MSVDKVHLPEKEIAEFCRRNRIRRLALFGSVLRDDFTPDSDVDVLAEFEPGAQVGYFRLSDLQDELSDIVGRRIDLRTPQCLSKYFRNEVVSEARTLYDAA